MNTPIMLSPSEIWLIVIGICGGVVTLFKAFDAISKVIDKMKSPSDKLTKDVQDIKNDCNLLHASITNLEKKYAMLSSGNEITQEAILALLSHALNNGDTEGLKTAKQKLEKYLITQGGLNYEVVYQKV